MINTESNKRKIISILNIVNREGIPELIKWLKSTDFFVAPASAKFHLNVKGGLAHHSLSVYDTLAKFNRMVRPKLIGVDTEIITGLLHDVCKIGIYHLQPKKGEISVWEYKRDDPLPIGHGDKSVIILQKYIELTNQEIALIRWHMGPYDPEFNRGQKQITKIYPYIKILYLADDFSTQFLEG